MFNRSNIVRAVSMLVIAGSAGYVFQYSGANAARGPSAVAGLSGVFLIEETPLKSSARAVPAAFDATVPRQFTGSGLPEPIRFAAVMGIDVPEFDSEAQQPLRFANTCDATVAALPMAGALVRLTLDAPCYGNQRILVEHAGLSFADTTDAQGKFSAVIPLLEDGGEFTVQMADTSVSTRATGAALGDYERVAVIWDGPPVMTLHAFEFGANFGDDGHVWVERPNTPDSEGGNSGGFLVRLGNPDVFNPRFADVYSFSRGASRRDGRVEFIVEAELNDATCGRTLSATSLQRTDDGELKSIDVSLEIPECGAPAGYLVLKNLFQDLKIARN